MIPTVSSKISMAEMTDPMAAAEDLVKPDIEPEEDEGDEGDDDGLEALRLAALNSIRPKEKTEPTGFELNIQNQNGATGDLHPETEAGDCPLFDGGFCRRGPACWLRHVRRRIEDLPAQDGIGEKEIAQSDHTRAMSLDDKLTEQISNSEETSRNRSRSSSSSRSRLIHTPYILKLMENINTVVSEVGRGTGMPTIVAAAAARSSDRAPVQSRGELPRSKRQFCGAWAR